MQGSINSLSGSIKPLASWQKTGKWEEVLAEVIACLKDYLEQGAHADVLKEKRGVGAGFVDGNIEVVYMK